MRLLLDTPIVPWWLSDDPQLSNGARDVIADGANDVYVSAISVAGIVIKTSLGKLEAPTDIVDVLSLGSFDPLAFEHRHAAEFGKLQWHHRDPFDRMLIAQARVENLTVVSGDRQFRSYDVALVSAGRQPARPASPNNPRPA